MAQLLPAVQQEQSIENILRSPTTMMRLKEVLQQSISVERFARVTLNVIRRNPKLMACKQESLFGSILTLARWGLEPGADSLAESYLVPYGDECQPQASYRGLVKMVRRATGNIPIWAEVVKEGDHFVYQLGDEPKIEHRPSMDENRSERKTLYVYAVAKLSSEEKQSVVMSAGEVEAIRIHSPSKNSPAWRDNPDEMRKKTAVRRLSKMLPMKTEESDTVEEETAMEFGGKPVIDVPAIAEKSRLQKVADKVKKTDAPVHDEEGVSDVRPPYEPPPPPAVVPPTGPKIVPPEPAKEETKKIQKPAPAEEVAQKMQEQAPPPPAEEPIQPVKFLGTVQPIEYKKVQGHTKGVWKYVMTFQSGAEQIVAYTLSKDHAKTFETHAESGKALKLDAENLVGANGMEWHILTLEVA